MSSAVRMRSCRICRRSRYFGVRPVRPVHCRAALIPLLTSAGLAVETLGSEGCRVFQHGRVISVPVRPEPEIDPTGAGDIFAAAFFIRFRETGEAVEAARFANACAALSVRKTGLSGVPGSAAVKAHYDRISRPPVRPAAA